jgi:uncharacterized protein YidB (DUF937 family)
MASKGMPSLLALLGLVAVAGYQNRDKLRDMIGDARAGGGAPAPAGAGGSSSGGSSSGGGLLDDIGRMFGGGSDDRANEASGRNLKEGLDSLLDRFRTAGQGAKADSWVSAGENSGLAEDEVETALGSDTLDELAQKTGLSRAELAKRLATALPDTVHRLTPEGRIPSESEARNLL